MISSNISVVAFLSFQKAFVFSEIGKVPDPASEMYRSKACCLEVKNGTRALARTCSEASSRAFMYSRVLGEVPSEWRMLSIIFEDASEKAIVAGAKAGAGAEDVVFVRDIADRDLSKNSTTDCR